MAASKEVALEPRVNPNLHKYFRPLLTTNDSMRSRKCGLFVSAANQVLQFHQIALYGHTQSNLDRLRVGIERLNRCDRY
jgi:hypothetical protein